MLFKDALFPLHKKKDIPSSQANAVVLKYVCPMGPTGDRDLSRSYYKIPRHMRVLT